MNQGPRLHRAPWVMMVTRLPGTCATYLSKLFVFKSHPFRQAICSYIFSPLCSHVLNTTPLFCTQQGSSETEGQFGFQSKTFEQRKSDPGFFSFSSVLQAWEKAPLDGAFLTRAWWKPGSSVALWDRRSH